MTEYEFAILHELKGTQFLVNTDYDHEAEQHKLSVKFWASKMNGFATVTLSWSSDDEESFKKQFDKLKDPKEAEALYKKLNK